jgi:hypothetical protein
MVGLRELIGSTGGENDTHILAVLKSDQCEQFYTDLPRIES